MKYSRHFFLVSALASGSVVAQQGMVGTRPGFTFIGQATAAPAQAAAARALQQFVSSVDVGQALPAGFPLAISSASELTQARIGWGFAVNDVQPDQLRGNVNLERAAQATGQWRYAVLVRGKPVGLLTMQNDGNGWQMVSLGGIALSRDIHTMLSRYGNQENVSLRYVRVPQATADFIEVKQANLPARYAPLQAARSTLRMTAPGAGLLGAAELLPGLRTAAARNLDMTH